MKYSKILTGDYTTKEFAIDIGDLPNFCSQLLPLPRGTVIYLVGDLGAGKTTLARELIRRVLGNQELIIASPTFTLLQQYPYSEGVLNHLDLYRLEKLNDVLALGYEELTEQGITLVEWPQLLIDAGYKPDLLLELQFVPNNPNHRKIQLFHF